MKIGIIGSGNMGRTLGTRWAEAGHEVFFGAKTADEGESVARFAEHGSQGGDGKSAAEFGDVLLYCLRDVPSKVGLAKELFAGKIVIDLNNSEVPADYNFPPIEKSKAETLAKDIPEARVVKAFNTMAQEVYEHPATTFRQHEVSAFVCGDEADAKKSVMKLAEELGLVPVDCGDLKKARLLESLADFTRLLIGGANLGSMMTLSVQILPEPENPRLGGRKPSNYK